MTLAGGLRSLGEAATGGLATGRFATLAALGVARGVLETAIVVQVIAIAFVAAGEQPDGLPVLGSLRWTPAALVAAIALTTAATAATHWFCARLVGTTSAAAMAATRLRLLRAHVRAAWPEQTSDRSGRLQELVTTSAATVGQGTVVASNAVVAAAQVVVVTVAAVTISPLAAVGVLGIGVAVVLVAHPFRSRTRRIAAESAGANSDVAVLVAETTALSRDLRTNRVEDVVLHRADDLVRRSARLFAQVRFEAQVVPALTRDVTILGVAAGLAAIGTAAPTSVGSLGATVALLVRAIGYGQQVSMATHALADRRAHLGRLHATLARLEASADDDGARRPLARVGTVRFEAVGFRYPGSAAAALVDVDLRLAPSELVGIVGATGAGKSTLVHLLLGLLAPTAGRITADGTDLTEVRPDDWHRRVAFVAQDPSLLTGTVAENVRFLRPGIDDDAVARAVELAALADDVARWPAGLDHQVGPLGAALSGGQRQRIALARALVGDPELLVLDEPTSALDPHSEAAVRSAVDTARRSSTVVVVAHRLSTLRTCDRIVVLQAGRVAAEGRPDELAAEHAYYREALLLSGIRP